MPNDETKIKFFTLAEANALLPLVRVRLKALRHQRDGILRTQAQVEIEEMTGADSKGQLAPGSRAAIAGHMDDLRLQTKGFEEKLLELDQLGVQLKDLDTGLVDFYSRRNGEVVFLCWKEGEEKVGHWHSLEGGFRNRKPV